MISTLTVDNLVISAQLSESVNLSNIHSSNQHLRYEPELFPAAFINCWPPVHVALFHNGKVIVTGLKSEEQANVILDSLISYVHTHEIIK